MDDTTTAVIVAEGFPPDPSAMTITPEPTNLTAEQLYRIEAKLDRLLSIIEALGQHFKPLRTILARIR